MASLNDFVTQKPRPLPVIVAVDRSGSMNRDEKINALNTALKSFISSIKEESSDKAEIHIAMFSFGQHTATQDIPLTPISQIEEIRDYTAEGGTPMGQAFKLMKEMIEDRNIVSSRSYKPTIVLITDGLPNGEWEPQMEALINDGRSSKAFRMAMAIGDDADADMLARFVSTPEYLVKGENARDIKKFFRYITMSVTSRMKSQTPDQLHVVQYPSDSDILDF